MKKTFKLSLTHLLFGLTFFTILLTLISSLFSGFSVAKDTLIDHSLETNQIYAQKLSDTADSYIRDTLSVLKYSADYLADHMDAPEAIIDEGDRLRNQTNWFNSIVILNADYEVLSASKGTKITTNDVLRTNTSRAAMKAKKPFISKPYVSVAGRLSLFFSQPIIDSNGKLLGIVGGTLYLKEQNSLKEILGEHYYKDGSYVYVVDEEGHILYHKDNDRISEKVEGNRAVNQVINRQDGSMVTTNTKGIEMIVGYSYMKSTGWGIVSQQPLALIEEPTWSVIKKVFKTSSPFLFISLFISLMAAMYITRPLRTLAILMVKNTPEDSNIEEIEQVNSWYYEVAKMKDAILTSIGGLNQKVSYYHNQSVVDPLTGLTNRRTMDELLQQWKDSGESFVVLLIDLDHFKSVNDTYGHVVGDEVLQYLARKMNDHTAPDDICCRYGGEEFVILFKGKPLPYVTNLAENLRRDLEESNSPTGHPVTMSAGVGAFPLHTDDAEQLFELTDQALYQSKENGRNQVTVVH